MNYEIARNKLEVKKLLETQDIKQFVVKNYEIHRNWVRKIFNEYAPTYDYLAKIAKYNDNWIAYDADKSYEKYSGMSSLGFIHSPKFYSGKYLSIGRCNLVNNIIDIPESYYHGSDVQELGCNEVYKMMNELNEKEKWGLKIINNCNTDNKKCTVDVEW